MAQYEYQARDGQGVLSKGLLEAPDSRAAASRLRTMGLNVLTMTPKKTGIGGLSLKMTLGQKKVSFKDQAVFTRQFGAMLRAGISATRCLMVLEEQITNKYFKEVIGNVRRDIESGLSLSVAMGRYPNIFSTMYLNMINAGEVGGTLEESLDRLASFGEKDLRTRSKIKSALTYPAILMVLAIGVVILMMVAVIPVFTGMLESMAVEIPIPTKIVIALSNFIMGYWWLLILLVVGGWFILRYYIRTPGGRVAWDRLRLKLPVFGNLNYKTSISRFTRTLATMVKSGVPILQSLEVVSRVVANEVFRQDILRVRAGIQEGQRMGVLLAQGGLFPPLVVQMATAGEESGTLEDMLDKSADFYDQEVDYAVNTLTATLEPVMLVFMGGIIGFIELSLFLPYFALLGGIK
jgi:type IV pilus assembly protein PilC